MKKRILFIDDEPGVLELYRHVFEPDDAAWEVDFATSGAAALDILGSTPCDVLVARWRMNGVTGSDFFAEAVKRWPDSARIVVSDIVDQEDVAKRLCGRFRFIARPIDITTLRSTIRRACSMQNVELDGAIETLLSANSAVPSLPYLYFKILRAMDTADASVAVIGEIIAEDPPMVAKVLQLVNSAFFGIARRISHPTEAVQILGLRKVRALVLSVHVLSSFDQAQMKSFPLSRLWNQSVAAGQIAQKICRAERADKTMTEEAVLACMLHDVGRVILASGDPYRYQDAVALALQRGVPLTEAEKKVFGASHAEVGAFLLSRWGLPISVIEAIALHHSPGRSVMNCFSPLTVVHVSTCLEHEVTDPANQTVPTLLDLDYLARIGLEHRLPVWREAAAEVGMALEAGAC